MIHHRTSQTFHGLKPHSIHIGDVFASKQPALVRTVLGSCIAVCLYDPVARVGGMNHFMLPANSAYEGASARYGIHAMELLINEIMHLGGDRRLLEAKVFGGGHVIRMRKTDGNVPESNIQFALKFLRTENIPIRSQDIGGYAAREVYFFTETGRVLLKRLARAEESGDTRLEALAREERSSLGHLARLHKPADDSNVTLF